MTEIAAGLVAMKAGQTQASMQIALAKKQHEMELSLISMLTEVARSAPAPDGMGLKVDKTA